MPEFNSADGQNELPPTGEYNVGTLGRYKILGELGRGGCGVVYRALDPSIGRMVAIKTILAKKESSSAQETRERFRREARSAGNLSHPNIVTVHDFSDTGEPMFIAMEFVEGRTLSDYMTGGGLAMEFIIGVLRSAADALDYAHAQHIVHRDVKPANFLINKSGRLKITDFGIAKLLDSDEGLTSTGMVVGTAQYMSPEQISEKHVTGRSDQFSLAVIAYEMLTGVKPFQGSSWATVIHAIIMVDPPHIATYRDSLGESVNVVLRKALSKDPEARYSTCTEFSDALEHGILGTTIEHTAIMARTSTSPPTGVKTARVEPTNAPATNTPADIQTSLMPSATREVPPGATHGATAVTKSPVLRPILIGSIGAVVIVAGLWFGLRTMTPRSTVPATRESSSPVSAPTIPAQSATTASQPAGQPEAATPLPPEKEPVHQPANKQSAKQAKEIAAERPNTQPSVATQPAPSSAPPVTAVQTPAPVAVNAPPPQVQSTAPTPAPPPQPVPNRAQEDQARRAADDQARRLAEENKRLTDEQARRAADDQAKGLADEQSKNARIVESEAISRALRSYQAAYERKDMAALQAIWPSIPKPVLEGIRGSFHDASEVSMELHPVGEPKIAGATATLICDRNLRQVILKRVLQASGRVRIVLNRAGAGWVIQSVEPLSQ